MVSYVNEPPAKPGALYAGTIAALFALAAAGFEGYFWVRVYTSLTGMLPDDVASNNEAQQTLSMYNGFLLGVIIVSLLISLVTAAGAAFALRGANGGRITMWIAGGVAIVWHLCCSGYVLLIRAIFEQAIQQSNRESGGTENFNLSDHFPIWMVDAAVIIGFVVGVASIVSLVLISLGSVNRWFRAMKQPPPMHYQHPPMPGGW